MIKSAFLYGFFGSNVGDVAVTQGALRLVRAAGMRGPATIVAPPLSRRSRETCSDLELEFPILSLHEWDLRISALRNEQPPSVTLLDQMMESTELGNAILRASGIANADYLFYTGGEHLFSYGRAEQDWDILGRLLPYLAGAKTGKKTIVLPSTFGPYHSDFSRELAARFFRNCSMLTARDFASPAFVEELGERAPGFALDPAFFVECDPGAWQPTERPLANIVMRLEGLGLRVGTEASKVMTSAFTENGFQISKSYRLNRDLAGELIKKGVAIRIFIQCQADQLPAQALYSELKARFPSESISLFAPPTPTAFIRELSSANITITSRFHSAIFSVLSGCPAIGLFFSEHGHKVPGLFEALECTDLCFDAAAIDASFVSDRVGAALATEPVLRQHLSRRIKELKDATITAYRRYIPQVTPADRVSAP